MQGIATTDVGCRASLLYVNTGDNSLLNSYDRPFLMADEKREDLLVVNKTWLLVINFSEKTSVCKSLKIFPSTN